MLCSTFCHLRVSHRFEVELAARRFGTNFHIGSTLGGLYPLSSLIFCVSVMPRQKPTDTNSREVLPHTWDTNRDKKQICKSVSLREKKVKILQTRRLATCRFGNLGHSTKRQNLCATVLQYQVKMAVQYMRMHLRLVLEVPQKIC